MVAMEAVEMVVTAEPAAEGIKTRKSLGESIYFAAYFLITTIPYACSDMSFLVSWTMKDDNRYYTLHYNHNMSTIGALLDVISFRLHRISNCVELDEGVLPFLARLAFSEAHRYSYSPSMTSKPVVSVTFRFGSVGDSKVWISWWAEFYTWY